MKTKNVIWIAFLIALSNFSTYSQGPCPGGPVPANDCGGCYVCDVSQLNGASGNTSAYSPGTNPCPGTISVENNVWYGFMATTNFVSLEIQVSNCQNSQNPSGDGLQGAITSGCGAPVAGCITTGTVSNFTLSASVVPGQVYYLMIDGFAGAHCDYSINVLSGGGNLPVADPLPPSGELVVCPNGGPYTYTIPPVANASEYVWTVPPGATVNGQPGPATIQGSAGTSVDIVFGGATGQICVTAQNACNMSNQVCINVTPKIIPPTILPDTTICFGECLVWGNGNNYCAPGLLTHTYTTADGCDSMVQQLLLMAPPIVHDIGLVQLCAGDFVNVCGNIYTNPGGYVTTCQSQIPPYCDSIVTVQLDVSFLYADVQLIQDASCGVDNGEACAYELIQGVPPYSYQWNDLYSQTTQCAYNLPAGTYTVTITDAIGCTSTASVVVNGGTPGSLGLALTSPVSCFGSCDGEATATMTGGAPPFIYSWDDPNAQTTQTATGLCAGTYNVTVTDAANCDVSGTIVIPQPPDITVQQNSTDAVCGFANGSACVVVGGGTWPYSYLWSDGQITDCATGVAPGSYDVTITDAAGCAKTETVVVNDDQSVVPDAGNNGTLSICETANPVNLFNSLGGTPSAGGYWTPALASGTNFYDPLLDGAGTFTYTVSGTGTCPDASADVIVTVTVPNDPGMNGSITLCSSDPSVDLFNSLGGTPDLGGTWTPALTSGTGVFDPAVDAAG
ncbi:MAG: SprB repeat-containing protein, partial [Flavobacteriales bacterium]|nr:SprB repeat-containing protein [Flavobacteriales bacterium]